MLNCAGENNKTRLYVTENQDLRVKHQAQCIPDPTDCQNTLYLKTVLICHYTQFSLAAHLSYMEQSEVKGGNRKEKTH